MSEENTQDTVAHRRFVPDQRIALKATIHSFVCLSRGFLHKADVTKKRVRYYLDRQVATGEVAQAVNRFTYKLNDLHQTRTLELRNELRALHLAACFIRGTSYRAAESNPRTLPPLGLVEEYVTQFGTPHHKQVAWKKLSFTERKEITDMLYSRLKNWLYLAQEHATECVHKRCQADIAKAEAGRKTESEAEEVETPKESKADSVAV